MGKRLSKIYTRTGDDGNTSLHNERISKDDLLVEAIGSLDELNSHLGFVLALKINDVEIVKYLTQIQNELFELGAELHVPERVVITAEKVLEMEKMLDQWNKTLPPLEEFLLPRGNVQAAAMHVARTVCRRAERALVRVHREKGLRNIEMLRYLNRLSDLLFVLARILTAKNNEHEIQWQPEKI